MGKNTYSVLELPLITEKWQRDVLDTKMECVRKVYNQMLDAKLKQYREMTKTREWRELNGIIKEELEIANGSKKKSDRLKAAYERKNTILRENGFSEFDFRSESQRYSKYYQKHISSIMASCGIGEPMWRAFEKLLFGNGNTVHFKRQGDVCVLVSDNKSGIRLVENNGKYEVILSNRNAKAKILKLQIKGPNTEYDKAMLDVPIKMVRIVKREEKGHRRFYCQITVAREPYAKLDKDGNLKHPVGEGVVGICIWRNTLYAVGDNTVLNVELIPDEEEYTKKREELSRKLEHLRRVNNLDNYNEDGTIKNGLINESGKRVSLKWNESNHYRKVREELRELYRVHAVKKNLWHNKIILELLKMGNQFHFYNTSFTNEKPEWDIENPLSNTEYKKKKQRRKSIQEVAPSMFMTKLDNKLVARGFSMVQRINVPEELYWYRHDTDTSDKDFFKTSNVSISGNVVSQTLYRAFLIKHFDMETNKFKIGDWKQFVSLPTQEVTN